MSNVSKTPEEQLVCDLATVLERMENANSFALRDEIRKQIDQERNNFRQTAMYIWLATKDHLLHRANREPNDGIKLADE